MRRFLVILAVAVLGACSGPDQMPSMAVPSIPRREPPAEVTGGPTGPTTEARVVRIVDGDTIRVQIDGVEERLRYIGIDTPESVDPRKTIEPYALAARDANAALVEGRIVILERDVSDRDRFGRLLRYVWIHDPDGWRMVNHELVRSGFASAVSYPPDVRHQDLLRRAESEARAEGVGLWSGAPG